MKLLLYPYFIVMAILYAITKTLKVLNFELPVFFKNYFTDLLFIPIILILCLAFLRWIKRQPLLTISKRMIFSLVIGYSIFFEWYAPKISKHQIADWGDVLMYALGGVIFYYIQRMWLKVSV